jgi:hypothetical protein
MGGVLRKTVIFLGLLAAAAGVSGQSLYHDRHTAVGGGGGFLLLFGDIGSMGTGYDLNLQVVQHLDNTWAMRLLIQLGNASDSDEGTPNAGRDFAYSSSVYRISVQGAYLFYRKVMRGYSKMGLLRYWNKWQAEVLAGPGVIGYHVTPGGRLTEELMTRSHGNGFILPVGVGVQYGINGSLAVRGELMPVFIFSDHVDGYASPHSDSNDFMYSISVSVIYSLSQ